MLHTIALALMLYQASFTATPSVQIDPACQVWDWSGDPPAPCDGADGGEEEA